MASVEIIRLVAVYLMDRPSQIASKGFHKENILCWKEDIAVKFKVTLDFLLMKEIYEIKSVNIVHKVFLAVLSLRTYIVH